MNKILAITASALILAITAMPVFGQSGSGWLYPHEPGYVERMFPAPNQDRGYSTYGTIGDTPYYTHTDEDGYTSGSLGDDPIYLYTNPPPSRSEKRLWRGGVNND